MNIEYVFKRIFTILGGFDVYIKSSTYHLLYRVYNEYKFLVLLFVSFYVLLITIYYVYSYFSF